ncbi:hypothetical protein ACFXGI_02625 [Streptomyces sp. NPDC059355]|uniref:hypothetical protein n=1 Tax=Streptomyces sp. NPDC059355 TaxID=3346811 RepID=UPI0036849239
MRILVFPVATTPTASAGEVGPRRTRSTGFTILENSLQQSVPGTRAELGRRLA